MEVWKYFLVIIVSYAIGNVSVAKILSHRKKDDITKHGSGNPGTINMLRTYGFKMGVTTLLLDVMKGAIAALFGYSLFGGFSGSGDIATVGLYVAGLSVVLGHNFPALYKFKGGKGVACILGVFLVSNPLWVGVSFVGGVLYIYLFDYGAISSFCFITVLTIIESHRFVGNLAITMLLFTIFFLTWFMHRKNIFRLLFGKENKANFKKSLKKLYTKKELKEQYKEEKTKEIG